MRKKKCRRSNVLYFKRGVPILWQTQHKMQKRKTRSLSLYAYQYLSSGDSTCLDSRLPMVFCNSSMSEAYCTGSAAGGGLGDKLRGGRSAVTMAS